MVIQEPNLGAPSGGVTGEGVEGRGTGKKPLPSSDEAGSFGSFLVHKQSSISVLIRSKGGPRRDSSGEQSQGPGAQRKDDILIKAASESCCFFFFWLTRNVNKATCITAEKF